MRRVVAAFLAAPLGGAGAVAVVAFVLATASGSFDIAPFIATELFALASILGYAVAVVLGIPGYLLFRRFGWIRRAHWVVLCASLGAIAGGIWPLVALMFGYPDNPFTLIGVFVVPGSLLGAISGLVFAWIIKIELPRAEDIAETFD
jgi:hypothetical protein